MTWQDISTAPRALADWTEEDGDVVWWCWRDGAWLAEPAYIGSPLDIGYAVDIQVRSNKGIFIHQHTVGGWPGYHTHWTPHPPLPSAPGGFHGSDVPHLRSHR